MAAQRFRPCSSVRSTGGHLIQVDRLDPSGPLHPDQESARWPIRDPFDAIDAIDLSQPTDFRSGIMALLTNDKREVLAALAVRNAPADDLRPILSAIVETTRPSADGWAAPVRGVVLGVIREPVVAEQTEPPVLQASPISSPISSPLASPLASPISSSTSAEEQHWRFVACELSEHGIELIDVLSIDAEHDWSSIALTSGEFRYPDDFDCRLRWYELE